MINRIITAWRGLSSGWARGLAVLMIVAMLLVGMVACQTVHRAVVVPPNVPGAEYIGSAECEMCHEEIYRDFRTADHARLIAEGPNAINLGCEACHGPGSLHSESGGEVMPPFSWTAGRPQTASFGARPSVPAQREALNVCFECHGEVRGQFSLPSHHPVAEGRMTCSECHPPHKGSARRGGSTALLSENEACLECHPAQRGPYVFEHEAMREGCSTCHEAHGSINAKLLTVRNSNLCLKCHFVQRNGTALLIGGANHSVQLQQGTCWTAGCHEAVHGSRVSSSLRF